MHRAAVQGSASTPTGGRDGFSLVYVGYCLALWAGYEILWEIDKLSLLLAMCMLIGVPLSVTMWGVWTIGGLCRRQWRRAAAVCFAPLAAAGIVSVLFHAGLDPTQLHFYLVKGAHERELARLPAGERSYQQWYWGLDAGPLSAGIVYWLVFDATDGVMRRQTDDEDRGVIVRALGDHFFVMEESEDGRAIR
jgi:hypothetical protein